MVAHRVKHPGVIQYLLSRLLSEKDSSFERRKQYRLHNILVRDTFLGVTPSPLDLLVYELYIINVEALDYPELDRWRSFPLFEALVTQRPDAKIRVLHLDMLYVMRSEQVTLTDFDFMKAGLRPPGVFGWRASSGEFDLISYGPFERPWNSMLAHTELVCEWIVDDWLAQSNPTSPTSFTALHRAVDNFPRITAKLARGRTTVA
jgi:hypothetical protein